MALRASDRCSLSGSEFSKYNQSKAQESREKSQKVKKRPSEEKEMLNGAQIVEQDVKQREKQIQEVKRLAMAEGKR